MSVAPVLALEPPVRRLILAGLGVFDSATIVLMGIVLAWLNRDADAARA